MELLKEKIHFETTRALLFQMHVPKHFWADVVSTACFLINQMLSIVLNWVTTFQTLFSYKSLFPIEPWVFWCTCSVQDVHPHVSKLDLKSLKCILFSYSRVQKGYRCYCPSLRRYLVSIDVTFLGTSFSQDLIHTSQGEDDDLLIYTFSSPAPAFVPPLTKSPITQVYSLRQNPPVTSSTPAALALDPISSDDLPIALRKGKR